MFPEPLLVVLAVAAGLVLGAVMVFAAPRLVAYRFEDPPVFPGLLVLVPLLGGRLAGWRPWRTAAFELVVAGFLAAMAVHFGANRQFLISSVFTALLLLIAYIDLEYRLVLNRLSYPGIVLSLALASLWQGIGPVSAVLGALVGLAIFAALQLIGRGRLGMGDTKLAILIGAMRGLPGVLTALYIGVLLGGLGAIIYLFVLRRGRKEFMPYGPYLAVGAIVSFLLTT